MQLIALSALHAQRIRDENDMVCVRTVIDVPCLGRSLGGVIGVTMVQRKFRMILGFLR